MLKILLLICLALFAGDDDEYEYFYYAHMSDLYNGNTFAVTIDMGIEVYLYDQKIRILDIDVPLFMGVDTEAAMRAKNFTAMNLHNKRLTLCIVGKDEDDRWLAHVNVDGVNFSKMMVDSGYAVWKEYK